MKTAAVILLLLGGFWSVECAAQSPKRQVLPRVGTIKDYPATGLMTGCGNLYFYPAGKPSSSNPAYVFLAGGDGNNAWMNLNGRDVRLQQVKLSTKANRKVEGYFYRFGNLRIRVVIEKFKTEDASVRDEDPMFKMKITLRRGGAVRIVRAIGDSDC
jgi:hypothetical protein